MSHSVQLDIMKRAAAEHVFVTEPGTILHQHMGEWLDCGISPANMLRGVEHIAGVRLSRVAERTLGGWATEETIRRQQANDINQEHFEIFNTNDRGE